MDDELKKILDGDKDGQPKTSEAEKQKQSDQVSKEDAELRAKSEQLENVNRALAEAQAKLREVRKAKKASPVEDDDTPKIDFEDPSAKAWSKHIKESVSPLEDDVEKGREEVRRYALRQFLQDKPHLAKSPEKVKELMETYERLHTASERTVEGVLTDLDKAFGAVYHEELIAAARRKRTEDVQNDILFSDAGVSRGATDYSSPKETNIKLTEDQKSILNKWNMTPQEWIELKKNYPS